MSVQAVFQFVFPAGGSVAIVPVTENWISVYLFWTAFICVGCHHDERSLGRLQTIPTRPGTFSLSLGSQFTTV